jgi:hypothetical protein
MESSRPEVALNASEDVIVANRGFSDGLGWMARGARSSAFGPLTPIGLSAVHTRQVLTGSAGDVAVVFSTFDGSTRRPLVSVRPPGGAFSPAEPLPAGEWSEFAIVPRERWSRSGR